jgi:hypothetical protein
MLLEKEYANPADSGYTYVGPNGEKLPLTPAMLNEWSRAMVGPVFFSCLHAVFDNSLQTDGEVSRFNPPNTTAFDPQMRRRSLFQRPPNSTAASTSSEITAPLAQASELLREVRKLFGPASGSRHMSSDAPASPTPLQQIPASPPTNTPSKLQRYLEYAEKHLGVNEATLYENRLAQESFGPDIFPLISEQLLVNCGLTMGDAVRLKRGASTWWTSPEAKRSKLFHEPSPQNNLVETIYDIRFEKRFVEGGSMSVFGSGLVPGKNIHHREFTWYYYNRETKTVEIVPKGFIPIIDPEYLDINAPFYEPTPSPELVNTNEAGGQ